MAATTPYTKSKDVQSLTIELPENVGMSTFDVKMLLASKLFELGKLSSGQAADVVGISKRTFIELLGQYNVSVFGYSIEDEDLSLI